MFSDYFKLAEKEDLINVEYHHLNANQFCSGATFVPNVNGGHEDHGWIISFVHDEDTNISQASFHNHNHVSCIAFHTLVPAVPNKFVHISHSCINTRICWYAATKGIW